MKTSVALCTYNGQQFLKQQLDSILNQTHKVDEIVVCDDGSTDKTIEILENYSANYPNTFYINQNEINLRSVKNFEKAVKLCSGDIIFLSDQDDVWVDNKVEKYVDYFDKNPNIEVLASNGYCIDENSKVHDKYSIWDVPQFLRDAKIKFDYYQKLHICDHDIRTRRDNHRLCHRENKMIFSVSEVFYHIILVLMLNIIFSHRKYYHLG